MCRNSIRLELQVTWSDDQVWARVEAIFVTFFPDDHLFKLVLVLNEELVMGLVVVLALQVSSIEELVVSDLLGDHLSYLASLFAFFFSCFHLMEPVGQQVQ